MIQIVIYRICPGCESFLRPSKHIPVLLFLHSGKHHPYNSIYSQLLPCTYMVYIWYQVPVRMHFCTEHLA